MCSKAASLALRDLVKRTALSGRLLEEILDFSAQGRTHRSARAARRRAGLALWTDRARPRQRARLTDGERLHRPCARPAVAVRTRSFARNRCASYSVTREHMHRTFATDRARSGDARSPRTRGELRQGDLRLRRTGHRQDVRDAEARASVRRCVSDPACDRSGRDRHTRLRRQRASSNRSDEPGDDAAERRPRSALRRRAGARSSSRAAS